MGADTSGPDRELLDAVAFVSHLVPEGSVYALLAEHRHRLFPDDMFADLFSSGWGRPSQPADLVATVLVLQSLEGLSDRDALQPLATDLRWKVAAGLSITDPGFHPTTRLTGRRPPFSAREVYADVSEVRALFQGAGSEGMQRLGALEAAGGLDARLSESLLDRTWTFGEYRFGSHGARNC